MHYTVALNETVVGEKVRQFCRCDENIIIDLMKGNVSEFMYRDQESQEKYHFYYIEYFYEQLEKIDKDENIIVLSSQSLDEYLFNKLLEECSSFMNLSLIVTKEVGRLFKENFNAKMIYNKNRRVNNG